MGNKAKLLGNLKDGIDETNQKLNEYKPEDPMDRLAFEKIHNLNDTTAEIIKKLQDCDITEFNKLQTENQALRKEIEISTEIKKMLEDREKNKNNEQLSEKEKKISECVDKFVKSNEDIKNFMSRHFLGQPMLKNELVFLEKSKYDLLLFQLDEEKMSNNSLKKKIEEMESENYLINLELTNMKNQLDTFKDIKSLVMIAILLSLVMVCKFIPIPSGFGELGLGFSFLFLSVACMLFGPYPALVIGILSDVLGYMVRPDGPFFIGYTIQAMVACFAYALCFHKTYVTFTRCLVARVIVNFLCNVIIGTISRAIMYSMGYDAFMTYLLTVSLPKNIIYLLPQSLLLFFVLKAVSMPLYHMNLMDERISTNFSFF